GITLQPFLEKSLDRKYSANPGETFFTGSGLHAFANYDKLDNGRILPIREGFQRSTNLVFIRVMRDLVRYHQARLPYDINTVLYDPASRERRQLLEQIAEDESRRALSHAFRRYHGLSGSEAVLRLLGRHADSPRWLAIFFYALNGDGSAEELSRWLTS